MGVEVDPKVRDQTIVASDAEGVQSAVAQLSTRIAVRDIGSPSPSGSGSSVTTASC